MKRLVVVLRLEEEIANIYQILLIRYINLVKPIYKLIKIYKDIYIYNYNKHNS